MKKDILVNAKSYVYQTNFPFFPLFSFTWQYVILHCWSVTRHEWERSLQDCPPRARDAVALRKKDLLAARYRREAFLPPDRKGLRSGDLQSQAIYNEAIVRAVEPFGL